jgi:hypothetical protein
MFLSISFVFVIVTWFNVLCLILFYLSSFTAQEVRKGGLADEKINTYSITDTCITLSHKPLTSYFFKFFSTRRLWSFFCYVGNAGIVHTYTQFLRSFVFFLLLVNILHSNFVCVYVFLVFSLFCDVFVL